MPYIFMHIDRRVRQIMKHKTNIQIIGGNWRRKDSWTKESKRALFTSDDFVIGFKKYKSIIEVLVRDIYLVFLPSSVRSFLEENAKDCLQHEVEELLYEYAEYDLVYYPEPERSRNARDGMMIFLSPKFFLMKQNISMPIGEYVLWHQKGERKALAEWSGIPISEQDEAYEELINFFRKKLSEKQKFEFSTKKYKVEHKFKF